MNINPEIWGKSAWDTIFYFCVVYPDNDIKYQKNMMDFIYLLSYLLPCNSCKKNYINNIKNFNIKEVVIDKENVINFFIFIRTEVAAMNGKKINITYDDIINKYYKIDEYGNINYNLWSNPFWDTIFNFSVVYPDNPTIINKMYMTKFINVLGDLLPSKIYKDIYNKELKIYNINNVVKVRKSLIQFFINMRKKFDNTFNLSHDEILNIYLYEKNRKVSIELILLIIFIIIIILIFLFYYFKNFI